MTPTQIDTLLKLEKGCCLEACENGWVTAIKDNDGNYNVNLDAAKFRWNPKSLHTLQTKE